MSLSVFELAFAAPLPSSNTYTTGQLPCFSSWDFHVVTAVWENSSRASFIILFAASSSFVNWILLARDFELLQHDLLRIGSDAISEKETVGQYVCKFFSYALRVCFGAPLKAL